MGSPILNGLAASSAGNALAARAAPAPADSGNPGFMAGMAPVGIGLLVALVLLAYWYRRVL